MKYVLIIGDGMADTGLAQLNGKTPLEHLDLPHFNILAGGEHGTARTVPEGVPAGSDTAILNIFGYDPRKYYSGRSVLEAAGVGVLLKEGEVSFRVNLCAVEDGIMLSHNGGGIEGDEAETLMQDLIAHPDFAAVAGKIALQITVSRTFRHVGVIDAPEAGEFILKEPHNILGEPWQDYLPKGALCNELTDLMLASYRILDQHPINIARRQRGQLPANVIWPWGAGRAAQLPSFPEKYHHAGAVISAVPLVWGIANLAGLPFPQVEGATGDLDTNYEGKVNALLQALKEGDDFAAIHVEAPDEMAHAGDLEKKLEAIRRLDRLVIAPLLEKLPEIDPDFRILLLSDHPTLLTTRTHDGNPVPYAIYDSRKPGQPRKFSESMATQGPALENGDLLMPRLFDQV
ncbi:MAG: 2,3-bisphosphoglycerate-independent phosphoglycerate mutase [Clostridia bacterium]|nr:2,3-bisphosphoglycerate-independent phosphoglycerate mutase [Clostridia bacterium]